MRRQGLVWLAATVAALGAAACFSDPTKALRNGTTRLQLSQYTLTLKAGDSLSVRAYALDDQGNQLDVGTPTWTSADPTTATVRADVAAPGDVFANGVVVGINNQAGVTTVFVTLQGVTDSVRVTVLPATFPGVHTIAGTAGPDTFVVNRPAPLAPLVVPYTAGDTLVLNSTATVTFSATSSTVNFGAFPGYLISRSATQLKVMSRQPFNGKPVVTNLIYAGVATTGPIAIASMPVDSINLQHARFRGVIAVTTSAFGPNTEMTISAASGTTFAAGTGSQVLVGPGAAASDTAIVLYRSATKDTIQAIAAKAYVGTVMITNVSRGAILFDSLRAAVPSTIAASTFPGTVTNGTGRLLDTIVVRGNGIATFTTAGAGASTVSVGTLPNSSSPAAFLIQRTADSMKVIAKIGSSGPISISNVIVAGVTVPSLNTQNAVNVSTATTGAAGDPADSGIAGATTLAFTGAADTITVYGSVDCEDAGAACPGNGSLQDYFKFNLATSKGITVVLTWFGNGAAGNPAYGSDKSNPDLDVILCSGTVGPCDESHNDDLGGFAGATLSQPQITSSAAALPIGSYTVGVFAFVTATPIAYQLKIFRF